MYCPLYESQTLFLSDYRIVDSVNLIPLIGTFGPVNSSRLKAEIDFPFADDLAV